MIGQTWGGFVSLRGKRTKKTKSAPRLPATEMDNPSAAQ
jgi:hypothetical protein